MIEVIVAGAAGKMGREVVRAVSAEADMRVVAAVDPGAEGVVLDDGRGASIVCTADLAAALAGAGPRVLVDFTAPGSVAGNV